MCYESWYRKQEDMDAAEKARKQVEKPGSTKPAPVEPLHSARGKVAPAPENEEAVA